MAMEPGIKGERGTMPSIDHGLSFKAWKGLVCDEDSEWKRLCTCFVWRWLRKCKSACTGWHQWTDRTRCLSNSSPASAHGPLGISEREGLLCQQTKSWHIAQERELTETEIWCMLLQVNAQRLLWKVSKTRVDLQVRRRSGRVRSVWKATLSGHSRTKSQRLKEVRA